MPAKTLTDKAIQALKPKSTLYRVADGPGLCLEVRPNGTERLDERRGLMQAWADYLDRLKADAVAE